MSKTILVSLLTAVLLGGGLLAGLNLLGEKGGDNTAELTELRMIRESLENVQAGLQNLSEQVAQIESPRIQYAPASYTASAEGEDSTSEPVAIAPAQGELQAVVMAAIAEDRRLREERQQQEEEQRRQERDQRRQEMEAMREGPYDRYNLKVNSMASVLSLTDSQKESYFALTQKYNDQFQQARDQLREQARQQADQQGGETPEEGRGRGGRRGGFGGFEQFREVMGNIQKEYVAELGTVLSAQQLQTFTELPDSTQSFMNLGMASTSGDDRRGMFGGFMGGRTPGRGGRGR